MRKILLIGLILSAISTQEFTNPDGIPGTLSVTLPLIERRNMQDDGPFKYEDTYYFLFGFGVSDYNKNSYFNTFRWKMPVSNIVTLYGSFSNSKSNMSNFRANSQTIGLTAHIPLYRWF